MTRLRRLDSRPRATRLEAGSLGPPVELRRLRVREVAGACFADVVAAVPAMAALGESHTLAERIGEAVREVVSGVDTVVHVEPERRGARSWPPRLLVPAYVKP